MNTESERFDNPPQTPWVGYIRGFGEHLGTTVYATPQLAREDASYGERLYRITHVDTVLPTREGATA